MFLFIQSCILLGVLALGTSQNDEQSLKVCNITDQIQGECILMQLCPRAIQLVKIRDIATLKNLTCGYDKLDVKVCCVTNRTDEALAYKNMTKETTPISFDLSDNSAKLPPDPNIRTTAAPEPPTTRVVYSTTAVYNSDGNQQQTKSSPKVEHPTANTVQRPTLPAAVPGGSFGNSQYDTDGASAYEQVQITPVIPPATSGFGITSERIPSSYPARNLPNRNECGPVGPSDRIYGGQVAALDEMPWLARIKYLKNSRYLYACHGSLISDRYVITAAHCVEGLQIIEVRLGEWDSETVIDCMGEECNEAPVDVRVESSFIYPYYNKTLLIGDIALLRLETPVNFTDFIRPICLPNTEYVARQDYSLDDSYVTGGWGRTEYEVRAVVKRRVNLKGVSMSTCRMALRQFSDALAASSICAGGRKGEDSCAGDSGSSLVKAVRENSHENWFLYGVTSFGAAKCGTEGIPGIYTRTTYYMDWIHKIISLKLL